MADNSKNGGEDMKADTHRKRMAALSNAAGKNLYDAIGAFIGMQGDAEYYSFLVREMERMEKRMQTAHKQLGVELDPVERASEELAADLTAAEQVRDIYRAALSRIGRCDTITSARDVAERALANDQTRVVDVLEHDAIEGGHGTPPQLQ